MQFALELYKQIKEVVAPLGGTGRRQTGRTRAGGRKHKQHMDRATWSIGSKMNGQGSQPRHATLR